jgi:acyl dehydratase
VPVSKANETRTDGRFTVGDQFARTFEIDAASIRRFAEMSGDHNPMHHDEAVARASRFGGLIASGTQTSALMMGALASHISEKAPAVGLEFSFRLRKAVRAGETLRLVWRVAAIESKRSLGGDIVTYEGELVNQDGAVAVSATCANLVYPPA